MAGKAEDDTGDAFNPEIMLAVPDSPEKDEVLQPEEWRAIMANIQEKVEADLSIMKTQVVDLKQTLVAQEKERKKCEEEKVIKRASGEEKERKKEKEEEDDKKEIKQMIDDMKIELQILKNFQKDPADDGKDVWEALKN